MADKQGIVVEDVRRQITSGLAVYDRAGTKVGTVTDYDGDTGWITVGQGLLKEKALYIPFSAVTSIDPRELYVAPSRDELTRDYGTPPSRSTRVEETPVPGEIEADAVTREPSGYDGTPVVVSRADLDDLRERIREGMHVYTDTGEDVGKVKLYDRLSGEMVVEKGGLSPHDARIPLQAVQDVDRAGSAVYLALSKEDLLRLPTSAPATVIVVETQSTQAP
jgi:hypothetical protein